MIKFFKKFPKITALMSIREDGNMKINHKSGRSTNNSRGEFFKKAGISRGKAYSALLDPGSEICVIDKLSPRFISGTDALIASEEEIFLSITVADCYPILLYDPVRKIIAVIHAGWKGISEEIIPKVVNRMNKTGSTYKNIHVAIGPGICQRCFEFDRQLFKERFKKYQAPIYSLNSGRSAYPDLRRIILTQLTGNKTGKLERKNIEVINDCTYCNAENFYSHRRDKKDPIDAMIVLIGMKSVKF